jgi:hypothetical protein
MIALTILFTIGVLGVWILRLTQIDEEKFVKVQDRKKNASLQMSMRWNGPSGPPYIPIKLRLSIGNKYASDSPDRILF